MSILNAALSESVLTAAQEYLASGVSIIPLLRQDKRSALKSWRMAQQYRASQKVLGQWRMAGLLNNVGIVCGAVSGNLVVLDFDSHEAVCEFEDKFSALTDTLCISSGSRRGAHYYFYCKDLPPSTLVKNYELRANGMYVVAPPSLHPSGNRYEVRRAVEPMRLDNMREIVRWIKSKRPQQPPVPEPAKPPTPMPPSQNKPHVSVPMGRMSREEYFRKRYIDTAVTAQIDMVACSSEGTRNTQLYLSAVALGGFVGAGALGRSWLETELMSAARRAGLSDTESIRTIASGINAGEKRPRRIPPPPAPRN